MRPVTVALAALVVALGLIAPGAASACSVQRDYRVPTNLELAAEANTIVFGQVVGAAAGREGTLEVRPLGAIKGLVPGESLVLQEMWLREPDHIAPATADEPLDFTAPHPEALTGACIRRVFPARATVLFFLERTDGGWAPAGGPFSRWAEDVEGPQSPWAQLVTLYARAAQVPPGEREALLQDQLEALQARTDDQAALAMAADIERSMAAPGFPELAEAPEPQPLEPQEQPDDPLGDLGAKIDALRDTN
jgi:hypothetical protein